MRKFLIIIGIVLLIIVGTIISANICVNSEDISLDINALGNKLLEAPIFEDSLETVDKDMILSKYNLDSSKVKNIVSYVGTGATAEEILILEMNSKDDVKQAKINIEDEIEERKADFESYLPKEVYKLENYNLEVYGNYLILCISNDANQANDIIKQYID